MLPTLPITWRPRLGRLVPHGLLPIVTALLAGLGYTMAPSIRISDMALFAVFGFVALVMLYLVGRPKLAAHERGLTVVNVFRRRELEWAEVIAARMPEGEPWPTFDLADGNTLAVMGIQASDGARAHRKLAQLQALLDTHGTAGGAG